MQALMEIMEPMLLLWEKEWVQKGILATVDVLRVLHHDDIEIKNIIKNKYNLSDNEAEEYL